MDDVFFVQVVHSFHNLLKKVNFLINADFFQGLPQISITKLQCNVAMLILVPELIQSDNVR